MIALIVLAVPALMLWLVPNLTLARGHILAPTAQLCHFSQTLDESRPDEVKLAGCLRHCLKQRRSLRQGGHGEQLPARMLANSGGTAASRTRSDARSTRPRQSRFSATVTLTIPIPSAVPDSPVRDGFMPPLLA